MGRECFCGCGRRLGWRANRVAGWAKMVDDRLVKLRSGAMTLGEITRPANLHEGESFVRSGECIRDELLDVAHDPKRSGAELIDQREMKSWIRTANTVIARTPPPEHLAALRAQKEREGAA